MDGGIYHSTVDELALRFCLGFSSRLCNIFTYWPKLIYVLFYFSCSRCRSYFLAKVSHWCMDEKSRSLQLLWPDWQKCTWLPRHTTRWK